MTNPVSRILLFQIGGPIERAKYYAIWTLTEVCTYFFSPRDIAFI